MKNPNSNWNVLKAFNKYCLQIGGKQVDRINFTNITNFTVTVCYSVHTVNRVKRNHCAFLFKLA